MTEKSLEQQIASATLLDEQSTADLLRISPKTLSNWRTNGKGPDFCKIGGRVRYQLADLNKFINRCRYANTSQYNR